MGIFSSYTGPQEFRDLESAAQYARDWTAKVAEAKAWPVDWLEYGIGWIDAVEDRHEGILWDDSVVDYWLDLVAAWQATPTGAPDGWLDLYNMWAQAGQASIDATEYDGDGSFATVAGGTIAATAEDLQTLTVEITKAVSDWRPIVGLLAAGYLISQLK